MAGSLRGFHDSSLSDSGKAGTKALYDELMTVGTRSTAGPQKEVRFFKQALLKRAGLVFRLALPHPPSSHMQVVEKSPDCVTNLGGCKPYQESSTVTGSVSIITEVHHE